MELYFLFCLLFCYFQALNGIERELIHVTSKEKVTSLMRLAQTLEQHVQHLPLGDTMQQPPTADTYTRATVGDILESIQEDPSNNSYDEEYDSVQTEANGNLRPASGDTDAHSFGDNHGRIVNYMTEISSDYSCVDDGEEEDGEQKDREESGEEWVEGEEQEDGEEAGEEQEGNHEEKEEEGDEKKEEDGVEEDSHLEAFSVDPSAKAHVKEEIQYTDEVHQGSNSKEHVYSEDSEISVAASMRALSDLLQELDNGEQSAEETMAEGSVQKPDCSNEECLPTTQSSTLITGSVDSGQSQSDVPPSTPTNSSTAPLPTPSPPTPLPQGTPPPLPPPLCAPPPPPSAPPPPGGQFGMKTGRTLKKTTQQKLRMFRFSTLPVNAVDNSVWKDLRDLTSSINTKALEDMFALEENKTQRTASTAVQPGLSKQQPKSLLDPKKAQNLGIFLMGLKMSAAQLKQKLDIVDETSGGLTTEQITAIRRYQPDKNEQKTLEQYSGVVSDLDRADQFMLELCRIPHLDLKLELLLAIRELAAQIDDIEPSMELVSVACDELLGSQMFVVVLEYILAVGNYINSSGGKGGLMGFHLSSLLK
ncbi:disheveled-associated activator of morphogenesis 1, partial [Lingula anatina]|uniref:Disheveled-associated activator of morphogenesis 1 n=1 Tax=Lingula anatina TaxID=7574 RepID=A0A1S3J5H1_LINAN